MPPGAGSKAPAWRTPEQPVSTAAAVVDSGRGRPAASQRPRVRIAIEQTAELARRTIVNTWRQPAAWVPSIFFPLMLAAIYAAQFERATDLPGFGDVDSFLQFILPASILQGIAFNSGEAGSALATDIESGFFDRLTASPVGRQAVFLGQVAGAGVFSGLLAAVLIAVFSAAGAPPDGGLPAALAIVVISALLSVALGGIGLTVALRTGSPEATQAMFPLTFIVIFVSSAFFPTELMEGWYQDVAEVNPFTLIVDPTREIALHGFDVGAFGRAVLWIGVVAVVTMTMSYGAWLRRLRGS